MTCSVPSLRARRASRKASGFTGFGPRVRGDLPGQAEECFLQGGPAQRQRADLQSGGGQAARDGGQDHRPVCNGQHYPARRLVDSRLPRAHRGDCGRQSVRVLARRGLQVQPVSPGPCPELIRRAVGDDEAVIDDHDCRGEPFGFLDVLGGQQEACAFGGQLPEDMPQRQPAGRIQAGGRLVEEQHRRCGHQAGRDIQAAAHATGISAHQPAASAGKVKLAGQLRRAAPCGAARQAVEPADHDQVLRPGQERVHCPRTGRTGR
jgi:hypothetical protein